jgi:cell wall-associated NlpC family hydrolase
MTVDRRTTPARADLADERLRGTVPAERYVAGTPMRIGVPSAPLRRSPAPDVGYDTEALMGEAVRVFDEEEGFAWVQLDRDSYVGYMPADALDRAGPAPTHRVSAVRTFLYPGPSLKLPPAGHLSLGAGVAVTGREGDYARLPSGLFVFAGHLAEPGAAEPDFVAVAERFLHVPYLWGGKTSLGLDCSGLIQVSLQAAGREAPRDSDMQARDLGEPVDVGPDLAGLRRGDLVFWKGHVGVMADAAHLLHANGHHMRVTLEPLAAVRDRIAANGYGAITAVKRLAG